MTQLDDEVLERKLRNTLRASRQAQSARPNTGSSRPTRPRVRRTVTAALVAAAILVVFFVPLPHVSLFRHLVTPGSRLTTPTSVVPATVTPTSEGLPRDVKGVEQSLRAVPVPPGS